MRKKPLALKITWGVVIVSWLSLMGLFFFDPSLKVWTIAVTGVAVVTEIGIWITAGILGLTMWESRKRILGSLAKPFKRT